MAKQGVVVAEYGPWVVVQRLGRPKRGETYVVVDRSVTPHVKVHGPTTRKDAEAYCRVNEQIWSAVKGQGPWT